MKEHSGEISPVNGKHLVLELPTCNTENFQLFLEQLSAQDKEEFKIVLLDNASFHKAQALEIPSNIHLESLPKYAPETNPVSPQARVAHEEGIEELLL